MSRISLRFLIKLGITGTTAGLSAGFLDFVHPVFDTASNFRLHFSGLLVLGAVLLVFMSETLLAIMIFAFGIFGINQAWSGIPQIISSSYTKPATHAYYKLFHFNMLFSNKRQKDVIDLIHKTEPDIISLLENSVLWEKELARLDAKWPHTYHCPEWKNTGGIRIHSKFPLVENTAYCHSYAAMGIISVKLPAGKTMTLGSVHLRWPWPASGPRQASELKPRLEALSGNVLVSGDFNATPWTRTVRQFTNNGGLQIHANIGPTWMYEYLPSALAKWVGFPIDHVMSHGDDIYVHKISRLDPIGSDHLPLLIEFGMPK